MSNLNRIPLAVSALGGGSQQIPAGDAIGIASGGTGATNAEDALIALGAYPASNPANYITQAQIPVSRFLSCYNGAVGVRSANTIIPWNDSPPQSNGGTQVWSQTLTPASVLSTFEINFAGMLDSSIEKRWITVAIFRNTTLIGFITTHVIKPDQPHTFAIQVRDNPESTTQITYSCRIGTSSYGVWYLGRGVSSDMGGANNAGWTIKEVL